MDCRAGCGACCIAPSISSPIPGMPEGKPAGVRCVQLDEEDRCKTIPGVPENAGCPKINFRSENIQFATGTANLTTTAKTELNKLVSILTNDYPNVRVGIEGHTDNTGKAEANQVLSDKRASAVKAYLVGKGIAATRLDAAGFGQTQPIADNATAEGRARNRRVAFKVAE